MQSNNENFADTAGQGWRLKGESPTPDPGEGSPPAENDLSEQSPGSGDVTTQTPNSALSNASLMILGVFGGVYLLMLWGWFEVASAYSELNEVASKGSGTVGAVFQIVLFWLSPLAPALWFLISVLKNRFGKGLRLFAFLLLGVVVLFPYPIILATG